MYLPMETKDLKSKLQQGLDNILSNKIKFKFKKI